MFLTPRIVCDGSEPDQVAALSDEIGPTLDVLVNAAGGLAIPDPDATGPALELLLARWQASLASNLFTAVLTTAAVQDKLAPGGSVVSIGSIGAERGGGSYGVAKAALAAWNTTVSAEIGPRGVTSNVVSAGYVTDTNFFQGRMTDARHESLIEATHNKRAGTPDDIADTVWFLTSPGARHITGQTIHVNGGAFTTR